VELRGGGGVPGASAGAADGDPREPHPPFHRRENLSVGGFREEGDRGAGIDDGAARAREGIQGPDGGVDREVDAVDGGALDADRVLPCSSGEGVQRAAIGHGDFETSPDLVVTEDINGINAGMFFVRRSRWSEAFLDAWWSQAVFVRLNSTISGDNHALNHLVGDLPDELRRRHIRVSPMQCLFNSYLWELNPVERFRRRIAPGASIEGCSLAGEEPSRSGVVGVDVAESEGAVEAGVGDEEELLRGCPHPEVDEVLPGAGGSPRYDGGRDADRVFGGLATSRGG
ncbi:hypothetical protein Taro_003048, partial [Colocasia esculenta]|nr:hypothetical protein [Colocasia esculenta]